MADISKITLPDGSEYNIKDAEALRTNGTAVAAKKLASVHTLSSGVDGPWKFLEIPMQYTAQQTMVLSIDSNFSSSCGLLRIHTKRISNDVFQEIGWIASGKSHPTVRWKYSDSKWNLYLVKTSLETISFHVISATTDSSYTWKFDSVTVEDFVAATVADVYINLQAASATSDANGDQIDTTYLKKTETAVAAGKLANAHTITASTAGWYKFLTISMETFTRQTMILAIESGYDQRCGLLRIHTRRNTNGTPFQTIGWIASGNYHHNVRWEYSNGTWTFYIQKDNEPDYVYLQCVSKSNNSYGAWVSELVSEPTTATEATRYADLEVARATSDKNGDQIDTTYLKSTGILYYENQTISIGANAQLLSISAVEISDTHVLSKIDFANPEYITTGYTWTTADGSFKLVGTCTAATTANILLVRKGN